MPKCYIFEVKFSSYRKDDIFIIANALFDEKLTPHRKSVISDCYRIEVKICCHRKNDILVVFNTGLSAFLVYIS